MCTHCFLNLYYRNLYEVLQKSIGDDCDIAGDRLLCVGHVGIKLRHCATSKTTWLSPGGEHAKVSQKEAKLYVQSTQLAKENVFMLFKKQIYFK